VEALRANQALKGALAAITAAVAGVVLNLAVWFSLHTVFAQVRELQVGPASLPWPELASIDLAAAAITLAAAVAALRMHVGMAKLIAAAAAAGLAWRVLGAAVG
jgi:chromate transporter